MDANAIDVVIPVRNGGDLLLSVVKRVFDQHMPSGWQLRLAIVDDGSTDNAIEQAVSPYADHIRVIKHSTNRGRAAACNSGALAGQGRYIAFIDADCLLSSNDSLAAHLSALEEGIDLSFGTLEIDGDSFWANYQRRVVAERERRFSTGDHSSLTTSNCVVRRSLFENVCGFDERYDGYGFEDRDLILRLLAAGANPAFCPKARVKHADHLTLAGVSRKMREAGRTTSGIFLSQHPEAYAVMPFQRADVRCGGRTRRALALLVTPVLPAVVVFATILVEHSPLPTRLKTAVVHICSGVAFLVGSYEAGRSKPFAHST